MDGGHKFNTLMSQELYICAITTDDTFYGK